MNASSINIAIAEVMGWKRIDGCERIAHHPKRPTRIDVIPNFHGDLNACADMEATLSLGEQDPYAEHLLSLVSPKSHWSDDITWECARATAPQRCEAFLRVRGKWVEDTSSTKPE